MEGYIAEVRLFAGNFAPRGWAFCQGQIMSIAQNTALFSLLGTTYGGNGQTTYALPDLRGRVAVGPGQGPGLPAVNLGQVAGAPTHTLIITEIPAHNHPLNGVTEPGDVASPAGAYLAGTGGLDPEYRASGTLVGMAPQSIGIAGGSQPHNNMQPYLGLNYIICMEGIYPSRN
ncbi:phage tail protein [Spirosoma soli]|uniref:Phage tail protein n=1 Tax=Spirosoma soli TaxID=1770529 RepID=A0ABW5LW55_9BACT